MRRITDRADQFSLQIGFPADVIDHGLLLRIGRAQERAEGNTDDALCLRQVSLFKRTNDGYRALPSVANGTLRGFLQERQLGTALPSIRSGKLTALAVNGATRRR